MFNNIKRKLMKYFGKEESKSQRLIDSAINGPSSENKLAGTNIDMTIEDKYHIGIDLAAGEDISIAFNKACKTFEEIVKNVSSAIEEEFKTETKDEDPKEKLQRKLQLIARRTKSGRIRKKNIKRLVKLFSNY